MLGMWGTGPLGMGWEEQVVPSPECIQELGLAQNWQSPVPRLPACRALTPSQILGLHPHAFLFLPVLPFFLPFPPFSVPFQAFHHDPGADQCEAGRVFGGERRLRREGPASVSRAETAAPGVGSAEWVPGSLPAGWVVGWMGPWAWLGWRP